MFKFTLSNKYRQRGLSPDTILPEMCNRFDIIFNDNIIDRKIQVRLDEKVVRFFYYIDDVDKDLLIEEKYQEIASISLSDKKETGQDILFFRQQVRNTIKDSQDSFKDFKFELKNYTVYRGFPFIDFKCSNYGKKIENKGNEDFVYFLQFCLLHFILDIEDRRSDLAQSPHYEKIREKLRESLVYQLLSAKLKYTIRLYEDAPSLSQTDYTFVTRKYTDLLIDPRINKLIVPFNYPDKGKILSSCKQIYDKQLWFYDPEEELETILEKNRRQEQLQEFYKRAKREEKSDSSDKSSCQLCLQESLVLKIRDFLYSKNAVGQAMFRDIGKRLFWCSQFLMGITSMALFTSSICEEKNNDILFVYFPVTILVFCFGFFIISLCYDLILADKKENKFKNMYRGKQLCILFPLLLLSILSLLLLFCDNFEPFYFYISVVSTILLFITLSGYFNNSGENYFHGILNAFFPRILVAELAAWITIGFAEDLVKSMLWVEGIGIKISATGLVLVLIAAILYGETNQLSPYKNSIKLLKSRVLPILNHAVFFAFILGLIIQSLFYENLIKNSDVMSSVVFRDYFDEANLYGQLLLDLESGQNQYQDYCLITDLKDIKALGSAANTQTIIKNDSIEIQATVVVRQQVSNESPKDEKEKHNSIVHYYNHAVNEINNFYKNHIDSLNSSWIDDTLYVLDTYNNANNETIKNENIKRLKSIPIDLRKEISCVRINALKFNNYDTLMNWATFSYTEQPQTGSGSLDILTANAIKGRNCCRKVSKSRKDGIKKLSLFKEKDATNVDYYRIFPTLLVFHTLIVLVIAFVTQLFINQKSVTEPI